MVCPFCRGEMLPGGLHLTAHPLHPDPIHWVPLEESTGCYAAWGSRRALTMIGSLEEQAAGRGLEGQLFSSLPDAEGWYCPACRKAIGVFLDVEAAHFPDSDPKATHWPLRRRREETD